MNYKIFGCKVNKYYLDKWLNYFENNGFNEEKDTIIATCEVTDRAKAKWIKEAISILNNGGKIYLTGCGTLEKGKLLDQEKFFSIYKELLDYKENIFLLGEKPEIIDDKRMVIENSIKKNIYTKKFIVIQNGCDTNCTFCLTIKKRGGSTNRDENDIISEILDFEKLGGKEIVITGINLASWGCTNTRKPKESKFNNLLNSIIKKTNIERIRISSLGPEFLDDEFFILMQNERFMPYFHISIQSFSDNILKMMNRNYNYELLNKILNNFRNIKRYDIEYLNIGADIIVGFPGETEENFLETLQGIEKFQISNIHIFPFSGHLKGDSVPASNFKNQLSSTIKRDRIKKIEIIGEKIKNNFLLKNKGKSWKILIEGNERGLTPNYIDLDLKGKGFKKGDIIDYKLV